MLKNINESLSIAYLNCYMTDLCVLDTYEYFKKLLIIVLLNKIIDDTFRPGSSI